MRQMKTVMTRHLCNDITIPGHGYLGTKTKPTLSGCRDIIGTNCDDKIEHMFDVQHLEHQTTPYKYLRDTVFIFSKHMASWHIGL